MEMRIWGLMNQVREKRVGDWEGRVWGRMDG